jgi:hypothetical protein
LKYGSREIILPLLPKILETLQVNSSWHIQQNSLLRKLFMKLCQRVGLGFMKVRIANWRYNRGPKILNISEKNTDVAEETETAEEDVSYDDIPEEMEDIVEILLNGLQDKDTIVRWSAAKGIGRVCNRLPKDLADEIVASILDMVQANVDFRYGIENADISLASDSSWHGCSLALAELSRRGLLLPDRLLDVIPWMLRVIFIN